MVAIVATECQAACRAEATLAENVAAVMQVAANHWMVLDRNEQFTGAVAALLSHYRDTPEEARIRWEVQSIQRLSAMLSAAQAGLSVGIPEPDEDARETFEPIRLIQSFHAAKR